MTAGRGRTGGGVSTRRSKKMQAAGYPAMNAAAPFALRRSFDWKWVVIGLCVVFTIYIAVVPLAFLLWQSFFTPQTAAKAAEFTLGNYTSAYGSSETLRLFWNSVQFAVGASLFAFVLGTALAWMNERTNTPFKTLFFALSIIPLIIPGILFTVAWILLGSPKIGIINLALQNSFGLERPLFNVYSLWGMIWVDGLHYSPMAFLLMTAAFRAMDPALEESATMSGANIFQVAYRVTLKLTWPAILATLLMLFVRAIESFEVPALLNLTLDPYRFIFTYPNLTRSVWNTLILSFGSATLIMLVTSVICWIVVKTKLPGRWLLDNVASLPMVFPGLVLGLSIMIFYLNFDIGIYGTIWIMFIAYVTRFMPYGLRYNTTSMLQIHKELEESAAMSGASWGTTFRRVILPLLKPGLVAGWIYVMIVSIRELSSSILLYSPGTEVLSITIWELWENGQYVELSALGVLFILALFVLVMIAQWLGKKFGVKE